MWQLHGMVIMDILVADVRKKNNQWEALLATRDGQFRL